MESNNDALILKSVESSTSSVGITASNVMHHAKKAKKVAKEVMKLAIF